MLLAREKSMTDITKPHRLRGMLLTVLVGGQPACTSAPVAPVTVSASSGALERTPSRVSSFDSPKSEKTQHRTPEKQAGTVPPGAERTQDELGVWWMPIPSATYEMGHESDPVSLSPHQVHVLSFWLQQTEVTIAQYQLCVDDQVCSPPSQTNNCKPQVGNRPEMPVACINQTQAQTYCSFRKGRLPTEEEWEFAARGTDGRIYPWGDERPLKKTLVWRRWFGPAVVGSTQDLSFFEIQDMGGNVAEWTSSRWHTGLESPASDDSWTVRGGSWDVKEKEDVLATIRYDLEDSYQNVDVGVRCAR